MEKCEPHFSLTVEDENITGDENIAEAFNSFFETCQNLSFQNILGENFYTENFVAV